ncbi:hypothetical protein V6N13_061296 [Hibiscus sabdariffa]
MVAHADGNTKGAVSLVGTVRVQQPISKTVAYMVSNPDKRGIRVGINGKGSDQAEVVVLELESMPHIERHTVVQGGGSHTAAAYDRIDSMVSDLGNGRERIGVIEEDDPGDPPMNVTTTVSKEGGNIGGIGEGFSHYERRRL